ncbi:hypothetical protein PQR11_20060 [Paraburkholderia strydomiana]|uniref:hypothetical protein n=1 Tax=Paraburkholderia strydomiana TaxID=1245417 RepID=UPI00285CD9A7|nr:hypothetical protein [Paraburkholderia strydomiana]MDR7009670.1 hypothetical protein [Paraburkholderia strydomiana]
MIKLLGILALAFGIEGCVAAQPPYGYGDPPGYYAPRPSFGIGIGAGSFGGSGFGGVGVGLGF